MSASTTEANMQLMENFTVVGGINLLNTAKQDYFKN